MPSIIDHFSHLIRRLQPKQPRTSGDEMAPSQSRFTLTHLKPLRLEHDRRSPAVHAVRRGRNAPSRVGILGPLDGTHVLWARASLALAQSGQGAGARDSE